MFLMHEGSEFGVMQLIDRKMGVSIQQMCIAKHYLMPNNIVIYHFNSILRVTV